MTFIERARELGNCSVAGLPNDELQELAGLFFTKDYGAPDEFEPLIESITPEHMARLFQIMADGGSRAVWALETTRQMADNYIGLIQVALDEANEEPWWAEEGEDALPRFGQG